MSLVDIAPPEYDVEIDLFYATARNFTGRPVYARAHCFLHADAAARLARAIAIAAPLGWRFRLHDAFRPREAQQILWNHTPNPDFLAPPERGSPHSRGVAVDIAPIDAAGKPLDMGTEVDAMTPLSFHGVTAGIPAAAQRNRAILLGIMTAAGWDHYKNEWWHYQLPGARDYPLLSDRDAPRPMMA